VARVGVVIPAYNPGPFLEIALRSVIAQTFQDWTATIVDDGSTEDIGSAAELDARISIIRQRNRGLSAARNAGITETDTELIAFLDADDVWLPTKLEQQLVALDRSEAALCSTAYELIGEQGKWIRGGYGDGHRDGYLELLTGCGIAVSTVLVRRNVLDDVGLFDISFAQCQDWHLWIRIAKNYPLVHVDDVLMQYRLHGVNMSRNYMRYIRESRRLLFEHRDVSDEARAAVDSGWALVRLIGGAQAFERFRATRNPRHLAVALRYTPRPTLSQLRRFVLNRASLGHTAAD
jgi:glycosyltransferase involved in cell wall biosynthesis